MIGNVWDYNKKSIIGNAFDYNEKNIIGNGSYFPNYASLVLRSNPLIDDIGRNNRTVFKPQSGLFAVGDYLTGDIASGTTVVSEEGTGSISLSEDQLDYTDTEFLWSFELSNGSTYEHPTIVGTNAIWLDTSGNGRHLTGSVTDINAHHNVDDTLRFGSDHENQLGVTISDGASYYLNDDDTGLIPIDVSIPALADGSGCAAYLAGGSVAPLTYPDRAKYDLELVNNPTTLFNGVGYYIALDNPIVISGNFTISGRARFTVDGTYNALIGGNTTTEGLLRVNLTGSIQAFVGAVSHTFSTISPVDGQLYDWELRRNGTALTVIVGDMEETDETPSSIENFTVRYIGSYNEIYFWQSEMYHTTINNIHFPLEESSGTTVYGYDTTDPGAASVTGTISSSDIGAFWSGEKDGENHNYLYGYTGNVVFLSPDVLVGYFDTGSTEEELITTLPSTRTTEWMDAIGGGVLTIDYTSNYATCNRCRVQTKAADGTITYNLDSPGNIETSIVVVLEIPIDAVQWRVYYSSLSGDFDDLDIVGFLAKVPANPNTGLSVLRQRLTVRPKRLTDQTFKNVEAMELMDAELNMDLDGGGDNSAHTEKVLYDASGNAQELHLEPDNSITVDDVEISADSNFNNQIIMGPEGEAVYKERQTDDNTDKVLKRLGVS